MATHSKLSRKLRPFTPSSPASSSRNAAIAPPPTTLPPGALINNVSQATPPIQAKLTVGAVGDRYEQEADRVAAEVVHRINAPTTQRQTLAASPDHELTAPNLAPTVQRQPLAPTIQRDTGGLAGLFGGASASSAAAPAFVVSRPTLSAQTVKDDAIAKIRSSYATYDTLAAMTWPDLGLALEQEFMSNEWHFINAVGEYQKSPTKSLFLGIMKDHIEGGRYAVNLTSRTLRDYRTKAEEMQTTGEINSPAANHFNDGLFEAGKFITNRTMPSYKQSLDTAASASAMSAG